MPGHIPPLDDASLARLREYVHSLKRNTGGVLPISQLVKLAGDVQSSASITLDLKASEQLGTPLVVVRLKEPPCLTPELVGLTPRETEICAQIAKGHSNKQIAASLFVTLGTVKDHVHNILQKTGLPNRAAIAVRTAGLGGWENPSRKKS